MDGFDHYTAPLLKWDSSSFALNIFNTQAQGRFTPGALIVEGQSGGGKIIKNIQTSTELTVGFAWYATAAKQAIVKFLTVEGNEWSCRINYLTQEVSLSYSSGGAPEATFVDTDLSQAQWNYWEFRIKMHGSLGELEIRKGGNLLVATTGVNTLQSATGINKLQIQADDNGIMGYLDDLYLIDAEGTKNIAPLGDVRVTALRPKANGTTNNFSPSEATQWESQNEVLCDEDVSFVEAGQLGSAEDYDNKNFDDVGLAPGTIFGVQVVNAAKKTDAGQLRYKDEMVVAGLRYDNGTEVTSGSGTYRMTEFIRDTDPSDDADWTEAKVAAVGSGFTITYREV